MVRLAFFILSVILVSLLEGDMAQITNDTPSSIVGGSDAATGQFPWAVYITFDNGFRKEACMGSLYKLNWVLTAAHCLPPEGTNYVVVAGSTNVATSGITRFGTQKYPHPDYNVATNENDIGLLKLASAFPSSSVIKTIPISLKAPTDGEVFSTAGFGYTATFELPLTHLQWVLLPFINSQKCANELLVGRLNPQVMICAGGSKAPPADTCNGDSGSALVRATNPNNPTDAEVVGLTSFGTSICASGSPAVYTRVSYYYDSFLVPTAGPNIKATVTLLAANACKRKKNKGKRCKFNKKGAVGVCKTNKCIKKK